MTKTKIAFYASREITKDEAAELAGIARRPESDARTGRIAFLLGRLSKRGITAALFDDPRCLIAGEDGTVQAIDHDHPAIQNLIAHGVDLTPEKTGPFYIVTTIDSDFWRTEALAYSPLEVRQIEEDALDICNTSEQLDHIPTCTEEDVITDSETFRAARNACFEYLRHKTFSLSELDPEAHTLV